MNSDEQPVLTGQVPIRPGDGLDHDHENVCCAHHGTHADPHRGCILR